MPGFVETDTEYKKEKMRKKNRKEAKNERF